MQKISFKGVVIGAAVDIIGSNLLGLISVMYLLQKYNLFDLSHSAQIAQIQLVYTQEPLLHIFNLIIGGGFTILGGYIAARIAKHHELLNGAAASFLCVIFALLEIGSSPIIWIIVAALVNPLLGLLGGYLCLRRIM